MVTRSQMGNLNPRIFLALFTTFKWVILSIPSSYNDAKGKVEWEIAIKRSFKLSWTMELGNLFLVHLKVMPLVVNMSSKQNSRAMVGDHQLERNDFPYTFSPIIMPLTIRLVLLWLWLKSRTWSSWMQIVLCSSGNFKKLCTALTLRLWGCSTL